MTEDPRCCGSGMCIIDGQGRCWCGQKWDGTKMCHVGLDPQPTGPAARSEPTGDRAAGREADVSAEEAERSGLGP